MCGIIKSDEFQAIREPDVAFPTVSYSFRVARCHASRAMAAYLEGDMPVIFLNTALKWERDL